MNWLRQTQLFALSAATSIGIITGAAQAVQLSDGSVAFVQPPRLLGAIATHKTARFPGSIYAFTLNLLPDAGEPLQSIQIAPDRAPDYVKFRLSDTEAFEGNSLDRPGTRLPIRSVTQDPKTRVVTVTFEPPVTPGKTITLALRTRYNPDIGGVYLYGVTAFPAGEKSRGQFLGYGRIQIYDSHIFHLF